MPSTGVDDPKNKGNHWFLLFLCVRACVHSSVFALFRSWHVISCFDFFLSMVDLFVDFYQRHVMPVIHPAAPSTRVTGE
jgi:hypothetical protein